MGTPATLPGAPLSQERLRPGANSWILGPREERGGLREESCSALISLFTGRETEASDSPGPPVSSHTGRVTPSVFSPAPLGMRSWDPWLPPFRASHSRGEQMATMQLHIPQTPLPLPASPLLSLAPP